MDFKYWAAPLVLLPYLCGCSDLPRNGEAETRPRPALVGSSGGLYRLEASGEFSALWTGGEVRRIVRISPPEEPAGTEIPAAYWVLLSDRGILLSTDLVHWEERNRGLPVKTIKVYQNGMVSFLSRIQEIRDLAVHPGNPDIMVCATVDRVFLSQNRGLDWTDLGMPGRINGIKAVAVANTPDLTVFLSHAFYGFHYLFPGAPGASWVELKEGLEPLETTEYPDEVSDIAAAETAAGALEVFAAQTFRGRVYRLDWEQKRFTLLWSDQAGFGTVESLDPGGESIRFIWEGTAAELSRTHAGSALPLWQRPDILGFIRGIRRAGLEPACVWIPENSSLKNDESITLSELWLTAENSASALEAKAGLYLPAHHAQKPASLEPYLNLIKSRDLNMVVIDMKDDFGRLRFTPRNPLIAAKGAIHDPIDIDDFLRDLKSRGIYAVARIVVFKDRALAQKEEGRYALWDSKTDGPWIGYGMDGEGQKVPYDEHWVDPYSEEVWEYIAAIAEELYGRGFDEIQFDYIRFPTDGINLGDALYRWKNPGMDMESAILSFLRHIRSRIAAPLSVDIYGANGWYRIGTRTGQAVELLAPHVDVICPMYYPSHFEQNFLAQDPAEQRPYRIYYLGIRRAARISRGQAVIRPYVQAFYLNVSYDQRYYNSEYVRLETQGVRDAGRGGLTYWNNSGRYSDIPFALNQPAAER